MVKDPRAYGNPADNTVARTSLNAAIHFISGLPRSGSTLLSAILRQNPRFHAGMTGPVGPMVDVALRNMSMQNETSVFLTDAKREAIIRSLFANYYDDVPMTDVVFDTNRMWCARLPLLTTLYPKARMICCVREMSDIYDSFERLVRKNKFQPSGMFGFEAAGLGGNVYSRIEHLAEKGIVGQAWNALRDAFCGDHSECLLALTYRTLTTKPQNAMDAIYAFIDEPPFEHDFEHVAFDAADFDWRIGTPGLHTVKPQVKFERHKPVLPPDLIRRFSNESFWQDPARNPNGVKIV